MLLTVFELRYINVSRLTAQTKLDLVCGKFYYWKSSDGQKYSNGQAPQRPKSSPVEGAGSVK